MNKNLKLLKMKFKLLNLSLIDLPTPMNISYLWNFGSLLGLCLIIQVLTGIFLAIHYIADLNVTFYIINYIHRDINNGWLLKLIHFNGASFFFICIYFHIGRNIYYESFSLLLTWVSGIIILLLLMMIAFLGYVLPWGQMSFWGATVITNLLSTIPYIGGGLVNWLWGGFSINNSTLVRFFSFHFLFPFILMVMILLHLFFLHKTGSNNPLGINSNFDKIPFYSYYLLKDLLGYFILILGLGLVLLMNSYLLGDPDNFIKANPMMTPIHIQPEWYFLFAYAILRCIPNKFGGVIGLFMSILILLILPFCFKKLIKGNQFYFMNQLMFWLLVNLMILLTWLGAKSVEDPYILWSQIITILYFLYYMLNPFIYLFWDKYLKFTM